MQLRLRLRLLCQPSNCYDVDATATHCIDCINCIDVGASTQFVATASTSLRVDAVATGADTAASPRIDRSASTSTSTSTRFRRCGSSHFLATASTSMQPLRTASTLLRQPCMDAHRRISGRASASMQDIEFKVAAAPIDAFF
jgi:hypothetical protein